MMKVIMCPLDLKSGSESALVYGFRLARQFKGKLLIVHASRQLVDDRKEVMLRVSVEKFHKSEQQATDEAKKRIEQFLSSPPVNSEIDDVPYEIQVIPQGEDAGESLEKHAQENSVDLIILSKRGHRSTLEILFRDVAEHLIYKSAIPVLLLKVNLKN